MPTFEYRKSSYSNDKAECVEIATNIPTTVSIRDSKNPNGPSLQLPPHRLESLPILPARSHPHRKSVTLRVKVSHFLRQHEADQPFGA